MKIYKNQSSLLKKVMFFCNNRGRFLLYNEVSKLKKIFHNFNSWKTGCSIMRLSFSRQKIGGGRSRKTMTLQRSRQLYYVRDKHRGGTRNRITEGQKTKTKKIVLFLHWKLNGITVNVIIWLVGYSKLLSVGFIQLTLSSIKCT
jgi:hypothetical protein